MEILYEIAMIASSSLLVILGIKLFKWKYKRIQLTDFERILREVLKKC